MSIGGFLGPVLAGLTGYAEQQKQAEQNRIRQQEAQMRQQMFQQYLKTQQDTQAGDKIFNDLVRGGGLSLGQGGLAQPQPIGSGGGQGSLPELGAGGGFSMSTDNPTRTPGKGYGGRASGGGGMPWEQASQLIKQYESDGGQNIEQQVLGPEGGYNPSTGTVTGPSSASGPYQMIDPTWRSAAKAAGIDVSQYPRAISAPVELQEKAARGLYEREGFRPWAPYNKNLAAAIGRSGSTGPAQPAAGAGDEDGGGGGDAGDGATAPMAQIEVTPAEKKEAKQLEVKVAQLVDPMARGKMSLEGLMRTIDKANPNASEHAKRQALEKYYKEFLAPEEQERRREDLQRLRDADAADRQRALFEHQDKAADKRQSAADDRADKRTREQETLIDKRAKAQGWDVKEDKDGTQYRYNKLTGEATDLLGKKPYEPKAAAKVGTRPPSGDALMTDDEAKLAAEQYLAGDRTSIQGWGRGAQGDANRVKIRQQISGLAKEKGWKGADVAQAIAEFEGNKAGQRRLGTLEATLGTGLAEANIFAPMLLDASEKVDRTQFPTVNSILMAAERGTGDESVVRYSVAFNALVGAYSQVLTRNGVPTDKARETARETFNPALSKDQMRAVIDQVMLEIKGANKAPGIVRGEMRERAAPGGGQPGAAPSGAVPPQSSGAPKASVGAVVQGPDGKRYRVLSVTPTGEPDEIEPAQ